MSQCPIVHGEPKMHATSSRPAQSLIDTVLDTIIDGVVVINMRGEIQSFNQACSKLFGYTPEEVIGQNVSMLMPEPYRSQHDGYLHHYHTTGEERIIGIGREVAARRKDGSVFPIELAVGSTHQQSDHAYVGIIRDVTERKEGDKARELLRQAQKMEAIGQLTGGLAHDFNNLLAIIIGNLDFIDERLAAHDPLREFIRPAIDAALHGSELTRQLLAFSRKQSLQPKLISVNGLVMHFSELIRRTIGERIELHMSLSPDAWNVYADPIQLENVLLNLSVNARDAMPEGGKIIYETKNIVLDTDYTAQHPDVAAGNYLLLSVSDTGCGINPDILDKVFDPFFTTKEIGKGSGLGLSMVYGFVKQSAGHIKIYSEPSHGTTIRIYLPPADGQIMTVPHDTPGITPNLRKVLIVEDNPEVLKITSSMVESLGYHVVTAEHGEAALTLLRHSSDIDLLLTDVMLPGPLNGPALAKQAMLLRPAIKVIFNSGYAEHAIMESGLLEEGVPLLSKPFRKAQLAQKIAEVLG